MKNRLIAGMNAVLKAAKENAKEGVASVAFTAGAMVRQTANELSVNVLPAFPDSAKPMHELGMPGVLTPQEVDREKHQQPGLEPGE